MFHQIHFYIKLYSEYDIVFTIYVGIHCYTIINLRFVYHVGRRLHNVVYNFCLTVLIPLFICNNLVIVRDIVIFNICPKLN